MFIFSIVVEVLLYVLIFSLFKYSEPNDKDTTVRPSVSYDYETRQVILNGYFIVTTFRYSSLNRSLFEYLYCNPGRRIAFEELDKEVLKGRTVNLSKVGDAMGFKCELRRLLFTCEGDSIMFHPEKLANYDKPLRIT